MDAKYKPFTKEEQSAVDLIASYAHSTKLKSQSNSILPELYPTWEAGRACGFHAGLAVEREKTQKLLAVLNRIASWSEGAEATGSFDSPSDAKFAREAIAEYWSKKK